MQIFVPTLVLALGAGSSLVYAAAELGEHRACVQSPTAPEACTAVIVAPSRAAPSAPCAAVQSRGPVVWAVAPGAQDAAEDAEPARSSAALARIEAGLAELQRAVRELDFSALEVDAAEYADAVSAWAPLAFESFEDLEGLEALEGLVELEQLEGLEELAELQVLEAWEAESDSPHECCRDASALGAYAADAALKALAEAEQALGRGRARSGGGSYARALEHAHPFAGTPAPPRESDDELRALLGELRGEVESLRSAVRDLRVQVEALSGLRGAAGHALQPLPGPTGYSAPTGIYVQPSGGAR